MDRDECEDGLVRMGVPEDAAVQILEVLDLFGPYEVRVKVAERCHVAVRCLWQNKYEVVQV
jgi:hypothetical protein